MDECMSTVSGIRITTKNNCYARIDNLRFIVLMNYGYEKLLIGRIKGYKILENENLGFLFVILLPLKLDNVIFITFQTTSNLHS